MEQLHTIKELIYQGKVDQAIAHQDKINAFLTQRVGDKVTFDEMRKQLKQAVM